MKSKEKFAAVGNKAAKITVKNYKVSKLANGRKKASFTLVYTQGFKPSKSQVHKMAMGDLPCHIPHLCSQSISGTSCDSPWCSSYGTSALLKR